MIKNKPDHVRKIVAAAALSAAALAPMSLLTAAPASADAIDDAGDVATVFGGDSERLGGAEEGVHAVEFAVGFGQPDDVIRVVDGLPDGQLQSTFENFATVFGGDSDDVIIGGNGRPDGQLLSTFEDVAPTVFGGHSDDVWVL